MLKHFEDRIYSEWLPTYCNDSKRNYSVDGFRRDSIKVTLEDAQDFIRAMDSGLITDLGGGRYRTPRSQANEVIFWEGLKKFSPRRLTLWVEPVITMAVVARIHLDYGWPIETIGMQSKDWAFDFTVTKNSNPAGIFLAGEVKKSTKELEELIGNMEWFCGQRGDTAAPTDAKLRNAYKKWLALTKNSAEYFWAIGPGKVDRLFKVDRSLDGHIALVSIEDRPLEFQSSI